MVWHLEANPRLSPAARAILVSPDSSFVVPIVVLAEIWHLYQRRRITVSLADVRSSLLSATNCQVYPFNEELLDHLPSGFEIHDAIIVATALLHRDALAQQVRLITCDARITQSGLVETLW